MGGVRFLFQIVCFILLIHFSFASTAQGQNLRRGIAQLSIKVGATQSQCGFVHFTVHARSAPPDYRCFRNRLVWIRELGPASRTIDVFCGDKMQGFNQHSQLHTVPNNVVVLPFGGSPASSSGEPNSCYIQVNGQTAVVY